MAFAMVAEFVEEISGEDAFDELGDDVVVDVTSRAGKAP